MTQRNFLLRLLLLSVSLIPNQSVAEESAISKDSGTSSSSTLNPHDHRFVLFSAGPARGILAKEAWQGELTTGRRMGKGVWRPGGEIGLGHLNSFCRGKSSIPCESESWLVWNFLSSWQLSPRIWVTAGAGWVPIAWFSTDSAGRQNSLGTGLRTRASLDVQLTERFQLGYQAGAQWVHYFRVESHALWSASLNLRYLYPHSREWVGITNDWR